MSVRERNVRCAKQAHEMHPDIFLSYISRTRCYFFRRLCRFHFVVGEREQQRFCLFGCFVFISRRAAVGQPYGLVQSV